jgi:lysophospholipid acyltransferase (LPLAT)-like uncharacterized protein
MNRFPSPTRTIGGCLALALRVLASTWRADRDELAELDRALAGRRPLLVGFWHGVYFPLLPLLRGHAGCIFIGEGLHGRLIAAICDSLGFTPVLLPHGDQRRALARMRVALRSDLPCATPLDGPHGPAHRVKPALLEIVSELGGSILPLAVAAHPVLILGWRWDRRILPLPFARIHLAVGEAIPVPGNGTPASRGAMAARIAWALATPCREESAICP